jgi:hypothetical protein
MTFSSLIGCATAAEPAKSASLPSSENWTSLVKARAEARWAALGKNDYDGAFAYFTEASQKGYDSSTLRAAWARLRPTGGTVGETPTCDKDGCVVIVNADLTISIPRVGFKQQTVPMVERWVVEKSDFYLIRQ